MQTLEAQRLGDYWVAPTIEDGNNDQFLLHVSIACGEDETINGSDLSVVLEATGASLVATAKPDGGPLPMTIAYGATAIAQYTFQNTTTDMPLAYVVVTCIVVTLRGQTGRFTVPGSQNVS
jgi:hypothetical protein